MKSHGFSRLGYSGTNLSLATKNIVANRTLFQHKYSTNDIESLSNLFIRNLQDVKHILKWNAVNKIMMYRLPSELMPNVAYHNIEKLPNSETIQKLCAEIGFIAENLDIRLSFHPGPHNVLVSPKLAVFQKTVVALNNYAKIFEWMLFKPSPFSKINFHIGGAYNNKQKTKNLFVERVLENFSEQTRKFFTIENDDKKALFNTEDLHDIYLKTGIPITFDYHHHRIHPGNLSEQEALQLAISTWPENIIPVIHYTDEKKIYEDNSTNNRTHASYIYNIPNTYGNTVDVMFESHAYELSVLRFMSEKLNLKLERNNEVAKHIEKPE